MAMGQIQVIMISSGNRFRLMMVFSMISNKVMVSTDVPIQTIGGGGDRYIRTYRNAHKYSRLTVLYGIMKLGCR
jgi:hypothetical protein